jgi:hypothetical protein
MRAIPKPNRFRPKIEKIANGGKKCVANIEKTHQPNGREFNITPCTYVFIRDPKISFNIANLNKSLGSANYQLGQIISLGHHTKLSVTSDMIIDLLEEAQEH